MARGTIKQRIALDGGAEIRKELLELGRAGEVVWAKLNKLSKQEIVPTAFQSKLIAIKGAFSDVAAAGDKFGKTLAPVRKSANDLGTAFDTMGTKLRNMALAVTAAAVGFGALVKAAADSGDAIGENAQKAGLAAEDFEKLSFAAKTAGVAPEALAAAFAKFNKNLTDTKDIAQAAGGALQPVKSAADLIASGFGAAGVSVSSLRDKLKGIEGESVTTKQAFQALGTTLEAIKSQTPTEQMLTMAKGFENLKSDSVKSAIAMQLFGKSGAELLPFFNQGADGIKKMIDRMEDLGLTIGKDGIKALGDLADETDFLGLAFQVTRDRIIAAFAPDLIRASNGFLNWLKENRAEVEKFAIYLKDEAVGIIKDFYNAVTGNGLQVNRPWILEWVQAAKDFGTAVKTVVFGIIIPAFETLMTTLDSVAQGINATFGTQLTGKDLGVILFIGKLTGALGLLVPAIGLVANAFKLLFALVTLSPFAIVGAGLIALAVAIYANWGNITKFFATVWDGIKTGATGVGDWISKKFADAAAAIVTIFSGIGDALSAAWEAIKTGAGAAWQWVQDKAREAYTAIQQFFSVDGFSAFWEGLKKAAADTWAAIQKGFADLGAAITKTFTDALASITQGWTTFTSTIANAVATLIGGLRDLISWFQQAGAAADANLNSGDASSSGTGAGFGSGFASGGHVRGRGTSTSDSIPAYLSDYEFVVQAKAVRKYGLSFLQALNAGRLKLPGFSTGGLVKSVQQFKFGLPAFSGGGLATLGNFSNLRDLMPQGGGGGMVPANIHIPGHAPVPVMASSSALQQLARAAGHKKLTTGGTKPSWYK